MDGGSLDMLAQRLDHTTTEVTQRYAHLQPERITEKERGLADVELDVGSEDESQDSGDSEEAPQTDADELDPLGWQPIKPLLH
jgi:hypothetical protein